MNFIVVGTNHKHSPIELREQLYFSPKKIQDYLLSLIDYDGIKAAVILSTCNRMELYADVEDVQEGEAKLKEFLSDCHYIELNEIEPHLYTYIGKEAVAHLFKVAAGLDSQILGETQILEQVSLAYALAEEANSNNRLLDMIFQKTISAAFRVRQETGIAKGNISIASIAWEFIRNEVGEIKDKKIVIIGVGKISQLFIQRFKEEKIKAVFIANRTFEKAKELAETIGAEVVKFNRLKDKLNDADIIISTTASPHFILRKEDFAGINKQVLIIDLAVPRDVEPEVKHLEKIRLFHLDDLSSIINNSLKERLESIPQALDIINTEVEKLCNALPLEWVRAEALLL